MNPVVAFTIIMLIWTVSDFVSKKTNSLLSSLFVASVIFLIGFKSKLFPADLLNSSSLLAFGGTVVGMIIVHIGTMISFAELKKQWKTFVIGFTSILGIVAALFVFGPLFEDRNYVVAAIGAISGGTISIIMVQEAAEAAGLLTVAVLPVLIAAFQGLIGFPITAVLLRKEANRVKADFRAGNLTAGQAEEAAAESKGRLPKALQSTAGTLFVAGVIVIASNFISGLTGGVVNTFIIALLFGIVLKSVGILKQNMLAGIDAYGLMMLAILILVFGPLPGISIHDLIELIIPLLLSFIVGVSGCVLFAAAAGKLVGYSVHMSIAIGLTSLFGFPGTMILSQEASKSIGETPEEREAIEGEILPKMIIAGFSTVTITSVFITSLLVGLIH